MEDYIRKNDEKVDKLIKDFSDHLPLEKDMHNELKNILIDQNREFKAFRDEVSVHISIVAPYIVGVESTKRVTVWAGKALMWIGGFVLTVGGAWVLIKTKLFP